MTEEEKRMLETAKDISNYCKSQKCTSDCIFYKEDTWECTLFRTPQRWTEYIEGMFLSEPTKEE